MWRLSGAKHALFFLNFFAPARQLFSAIGIYASRPDLIGRRVTRIGSLGYIGEPRLKPRGLANKSSEFLIEY